MKNKTENRQRNHQIKIYLDDEEVERLNRNIKRSGIEKKSKYIRQMILFGKSILVKDDYFKKCYTELNRIGTNLNSMLRYAQSTGELFIEDIQMIKDSYSNIFHMMNGIYYKIEELEKAVKQSGFETLSEKIERILREK